MYSPFRGRSGNFHRYNGYLLSGLFVLAFFLHIPQLARNEIVSLPANSRLLFSLTGMEQYEVSTITNNTTSIHTDNSSNILYSVGARFQEYHMTWIQNYASYALPVVTSFLPCLLLIIFNVGLIYQLKLVQNERSQIYAQPGNSNVSGCNIRINVVLVIMICAYIVLVSPSDVMKYVEVYDVSDYQIDDIVTCSLNLAQTCNFALNFMLYISFNSKSCEMLLTFFLRFCCCCCCHKKSHLLHLPLTAIDEPLEMEEFCQQ